VCSETSARKIQMKGKITQKKEYHNNNNEINQSSYSTTSFLLFYTQHRSQQDSGQVCAHL